MEGRDKGTSLNDTRRLEGLVLFNGKGLRVGCHLMVEARSLEFWCNLTVEARRHEG